MPTYPFDYSEVRGQPIAKRALEIAAAGGHNILLIGTPGSGKTMLARRLVTILPPPTEEELEEVTDVYRAADALMMGKSDLLPMRRRPFCAPHFTISPVGMMGGGKESPRPGQISLSHHGVLFLDELPEFNKRTLSIVTAALKDKKVKLERKGQKATFPCDVHLVAAMNPCPCGYRGHGELECVSCFQRTPGFLDRIRPLIHLFDMSSIVESVSYTELINTEKEVESSKDIQKRVIAARERQRRRFLEEKRDELWTNSEILPGALNMPNHLDDKADKLMDRCIDVLGLTAQGIWRLFQVARTIADLAREELINDEHVAEAIGFRIEAAVGAL